MLEVAVQVIAAILFYYVFGLAAILLTIYIVQTCIRFIRDSEPKKGDEKP